MKSVNTRPTKKTAQDCWAASGYRCASPNCGRPVLEVKRTGGRRIAERTGSIAHIYGAKPESNRHDPSVPAEFVRSFENLMVLCDWCHKKPPDGIDLPSNEARFPVELLQRWRQEHLARIESEVERNWIAIPVVVESFRNGVQERAHVWFDGLGNPRLYTKKQLAVATKVVELFNGLRTIHGMLEQVECTGGKPANPSAQNQSDALLGNLYREMKHLPGARHGEQWLENFAQGAQCAFDVTLGEFLLASASGEPGFREKKMREWRAKRNGQS